MVSAVSGSRLADNSAERAGARRSLGLVAEQGLYNLIERRAELEVLPACRAYGVGVIPWSPLAGGALAADEPAAERGDTALAIVSHGCADDPSVSGLACQDSDP